MGVPAELHLYQEVMLLALREQSGTVVSGSWYQQAVGAAVLAELLLAGRIAIGTGRRPKVQVVSCEPLGDPLLDESLESMADDGKQRWLITWLGRIARQPRLKRRVAAGLVAAGILRADVEKVLLFFERAVYPEADPEPERAVLDKLRAAVFDAGAEPDERTVILLSIAHRTGLLKASFGRKPIRERKARIEALIEGEQLGAAARAAVEAVQAAVIVVVT